MITRPEQWKKRNVNSCMCYAAVANCQIVNFLESRKFVERFWLQWRPPAGIHFHWRGLKKCFLQFKTFRRVIYIQIYILGGYNSTGGIHLSFQGFLIPLGDSDIFPGGYNPTGGIQLSFQGVLNSTGGIQLSFLGVYNSTGGIQLSFQGVYNSTGGIQLSLWGL